MVIPRPCFIKLPEPPIVAVRPTGGAWVTLPAASNINEEAAVPVVIFALISILLAAVSVKLCALLQAKGSTTIILPTPVPLELVVITVILLVPSALVSVAVLNKESREIPVACEVPAFMESAVWFGGVAFSIPPCCAFPRVFAI